MSPPAPALAPDLILHGGRVRTMAPDGSIAAAVAVAGDRIATIGRDADVLSGRGPRTRVVDLRGRTVLPGFIDAHTHPLGGGLKHIECALDRWEHLDEHLAAIKAYADAHPELEWIVGDGWSLDTFPDGIARREPLDAVVPDRPAFFYNRDGHGAWVNTRALELAGITAATPDPPNGRIDRDPDGTPVGMLQEWATHLVFDLIPPYGAEVLERALLDAQAELHGLGVTGWQEARAEPELAAAYRAIAGRGELTARVNLALGWASRDAFGGLEGLVAIREAVAADARAAGGGRAPGSGRLAARSIKLFLDGIIENQTAALLGSYVDADGRATGVTGVLNYPTDDLQRAAKDLDRRGFQLHCHAIGDGAVRQALDVFEAVRRVNGPRDSRHHVAHIQVVHPDDVPRFAALDAIPTMQPLWAVHETQMDELTIPILGPERSGWQYPFGSLARAGARLAMGSDWTVSTPDPFPQLEVAVRRVFPGSSHEPLLPDEALTLDEALHAATVGSAHVNWQDEAGWLSVGRLADLVVLDRDLDDRAAGAISDARIVATVVGGAFVVERPELEGG